tara:strand:- start:156 stop:1613 length:1458 start_codon:yes stop_codon:yes gene_type:complete
MDQLIQDFSVLSVSERKYCLSLMKTQLPSSSSHFYKSWFSSSSSHEKLSNFYKILNLSSLDQKQHQIEGVQWLLNKEITHSNYDNRILKGGILADEMGLGKTLQIIGAIVCNFKFKTLIVVPCALLDQWVDAIIKYLQLKPFVFHSTYNTKQHTYDFAITITTYGMISKHKTVITSQNWDRVVFDEAHHLRNINSETYKGASELSTNIFWFISGTPIQNKFDDVHSLLFLLKYNKNDLQNKAAVQQLLRPLLIKRTKASVNLPMPSLSHYNLYIDWNNDDEYSLAMEMHQISKLTNPDENELYTKHDKIVSLLRAKQSCINSFLIPLEKRRDIQLPDVSTKLQYVHDTIVSNGFHNPKLIFCQFRLEIDMIYNCLAEYDINIGVFDGRTTPHDRKTMLQQSFDVLILQIQCACEGLNLQHYNEIYFVSPHWNPAVQQQAIARCHRIGQKHNVRVYNFYMKSFNDEMPSMDIIIKNTQQRKLLDFV